MRHTTPRRATPCHATPRRNNNVYNFTITRACALAHTQRQSESESETACVGECKSSEQRASETATDCAKADCYEPPLTVAQLELRLLCVPLQCRSMPALLSST